MDFHDKRGTPNSYNLPADPYNDRNINRLGALAELVVATLLGAEETWVECTDNYQNLKGDVIDGIQVRSSQKTYGCLLMHDRDRDDHAFVQCRHHLINSKPTALEVIGWCEGAAGKQQQFWWTGKNGNRPCYRVPDDVLTPGIRGLRQWAATRTF
jgi:uncharacterized CHY-type Zn-finger protein